MLSTIKPEFIDVPIGLIDAPELPSRSEMDEEKLDELTDDIRRNGLLQNLVLARTGDRFQVVAGHRRTLACKRAGLVFARALVYPSLTDALEAAKFAENRYREDLNPADEAIYFDELLEHKCGGDVDALCQLIGEKRGYVEGRLMLFQGDPDVFKALQAGKIAIGVAHQLNKCTDEPYRRSLLHSAVAGGATVAVVSGWILDWKKQEAYITGSNVPAPLAAPLSAVPQSNYFTCYVCGGVEHVHTMQPVNVHAHCKLAILDKLLDAYRGES